MILELKSPVKPTIVYRCDSKMNSTVYANNPWRGHKLELLIMGWVKELNFVMPESRKQYTGDPQVKLVI